MKQPLILKLKRPLSLLTAICCLTSLLFSAACSAPGLSGETSPAVQIGSVAVSDDVFTYFLDAAAVEGKYHSYDAVLSRALTLLGTYFKTNSLAHKNGVSLTTAEKASVSEKVASYWSLFGTYYTKLGITKETLTKVYTADCYRTALLNFYYGSSGKNAVSDATLYAYFQTNYIVFRVITGYLTQVNDSGRTVPIPRNDIETIAIKFQNMATLINLGEKTMDAASDFVKNGDYTSSVATVVLKNDSDDYPAGFFEKVQSSKAGKASIIGTTEFIFLVMRQDANIKSSYFIKKKSEILTTLVGSAIDNDIDASMKLSPKVSSQKAKAVYQTLTEVRSK